jgi:hypothetical protein
MNFLPEKKYGVPSHNFWEKNFCAKNVTKLPDLTVLVITKCYATRYSYVSGFADLRHIFKGTIRPD